MTRDLYPAAYPALYPGSAAPVGSFPDIPLDVRAELGFGGGVWADVTSYLDHGPVSLGRGHPDESATVSPSTLALTLTNNGAQFSSKNPAGPWYPSLVRNTPLRVSIPSDQPYLRLEQDRTSFASCPFSAPLGISGDLDVRADMQPSHHGGIAAGMWGASGATGSWSLLPGATFPALWWSPDGFAIVQATATARLPPGRFALRATLAVASGTVTFYTGPAGGADSGPWTQLGQAVVLGATSLHAGSTALQCGVSGAGPSSGFLGRIYELEVRAGIGGTVVAHPAFSAQAAGTTSFADAQGNKWALSGTSELSARDYRLHAEVPEWPQHQDPTGKTWTVSAQGGGLLRRLSQRNNALNSAMWRAWVKTGASLAAYHPMEDGPGATSLASATGGPAAQFSGALKLASNSDFLASAPLPVLNGAVITGRVPAYAPGWNGHQVSWLLEVPQAGEANGAEVMRIATTGTVAQLVVTYGTSLGGTLTLTGYNSSGTQLFTSGAVAFGGINGQPLLALASLAPDGSGGANWAIGAQLTGAVAPGITGGNIGSSSTGAVTSWTLDGGGQLLQTVAGHVGVQAVRPVNGLPLPGPPGTSPPTPLAAWAGEAAGSRFSRLCGEEGIQFRSGGDLTQTILMGVQSQQTLVALLQECASADRGVWYELRQQLGWGYIPRNALYNQAAAVAVTYATDMLGEWASDPTEDDKDIRNDETVSQATGGGSARQFAAPGQPVAGGRLSTLSPPSGSGTYDGSDTLNVWQVSDLPSLAAWIAHVGIVDEPRYPGIVLDLSNRGLASLFYQVLALELGQRVTIASPPAQLGPDPVSVLAWQLSEEIWFDTLKITIAGVPGRPYLIAREGATTGRADTDGSTLALGVTAAAATLQVVTAAGFPPWTTAGGDFPFDVNIAGERVTVTGIAGASSPQAFTVARAVNGVSKAQAAGTAIALWDTPAAAL